MYYKKKDNKVLMIIVIVILLVFSLSITFFISKSFKKESNKSNLNGENFSTPELDLKLSNTAKGVDKVDIIVKATVADGQGIKEIVLPNNQKALADNATYSVTANGEYKFSVYSNNGVYNEKSITVSNIKEATADEPYIPVGFKHKEGTVADGFVITDGFENEFVWIPVENGQLLRDNIQDRKFSDKTGVVKELSNSVSKYKGYYVSRYEAQQANVNGATAGYVPISRKGNLPWTLITFEDANQAATSMAQILGYKGVKTSLMSSYSWYTMLKWIDQNNPNFSRSIDRGNYTGEVLRSGETSTDMANNICDLAGNVREWTTETYEDVVQNTNNNVTANPGEKEVTKNIKRVLRGGSSLVNNTPLKATAADANQKDATWGFRVVLFKD